ncbi:MAG: hypothetical protein JSR24_04135 [Proteobacteria bacterium]|nr:hypothetical protein [Pseudomonadota bacterium]
MKISARDIDHLTLNTTDPGTVAAKLEKLGFTLTPDGVWPRCICFVPADEDIPNYIEIAESPVDFMNVAMNVEKLKGEKRTFKWEGNDGDITGSLIVGEGGGPVPWLTVQQFNPESFVEPELVVHPNGALAFICVHVVADDPKAIAKQLAATWDGRAEEVLDGCELVRTGMVELLIWTPAAWQKEYKAIEPMEPARKPAITGIAVAIERARPLQALLRANNVPFSLTEGDRILVAPEQTGGLVIEFMPQT